MTAPLFIWPEDWPKPCRLLTVGDKFHVTACRMLIAVDHPCTLTARVPDNLCEACKRDLAIKRSRLPTIDLRPYVRELGVSADVEVEP